MCQIGSSKLAYKILRVQMPGIFREIDARTKLLLTFVYDSWEETVWHLY